MYKHNLLAQALRLVDKTCLFLKNSRRTKLEHSDYINKHLNKIKNMILIDKTSTQHHHGLAQLEFFKKPTYNSSNQHKNHAFNKVKHDIT